MRDATTVTAAVGEATRYEWPDGSAIVAHGHRWDYGVHRDRLAEARERLDAEATWLIAADLADITRGEPAVAHIGATANDRIGDGLADLVWPATAAPTVATQAEVAIIRLGGDSLAACIRPMTMVADAQIAAGVVDAIKAARAARIEAGQIRAAAGAATRRLVVAQEAVGADARDDVRQLWVAVAAATRRLVAAQEAVDTASSAAGGGAPAGSTNRRGKRVNPESLIDAIERLAAYKGVSPHTIGSYAGRSGDFLRRLYAGSDLTTRRGERVVRWLSDHWPEDLDWPANIERPQPVGDPNDSA